MSKLIFFSDKDQTILSLHVDVINGFLYSIRMNIVAYFVTKNLGFVRGLHVVQFFREEKCRK